MPAQRRPQPTKRNPTARRQPAKGRREANKEKTRQQILTAALELFRKKGFFQTTTKEISRRAKIAEGTLFNYFRTKEDLALYFFEQEIADLITWFETDRGMQDAPLPEKLFGIILRHLDRISPYEDFIGAVYLRALLPSSKLNPASLESQALNIHYLRFIREVLAGAETAGEIPSVGDLGAYGFGLFHLGMITYWLNDRSPGKENTLATLDRSLKLATTFMRKKGWEW